MQFSQANVTCYKATPTPWPFFVSLMETFLSINDTGESM